jgi:hypothetical protein
MSLNSLIEYIKESCIDQDKSFVGRVRQLRDNCGYPVRHFYNSHRVFVGNLDLKIKRNALSEVYHGVG